jgi:hypothetical protein
MMRLTLMMSCLILIAALPGVVAEDGQGDDQPQSADQQSSPPPPCPIAMPSGLPCPMGLVGVRSGEGSASNACSARAGRCTAVAVPTVREGPSGVPAAHPGYIVICVDTGGAC